MVAGAVAADLVVLSGGVSVPAAALRLVWNLEARGVAFAVADWKPSIVAVVAHCQRRLT